MKTTQKLSSTIWIIAHNSHHTKGVKTDASLNPGNDVLHPWLGMELEFTHQAHKVSQASSSTFNHSPGSQVALEATHLDHSIVTWLSSNYM